MEEPHLDHNVCCLHHTMNSQHSNVDPKLARQAQHEQCLASQSLKYSIMLSRSLNVIAHYLSYISLIVDMTSLLQHLAARSRFRDL